MLRIPLVIALVAAALIACNGTSTVNFRSDDSWNYLTVSMTEQQVRDLLVPALENGRDLRMRNVSVELRPGEIIARGDVVGQDGRLYPGSMSIRAWAADRRLNLQITTFNFAGFNADAAMLSRVNSDIADGLARSAANSTSETTDVTITDSALSITWRSPK